MSRFDPKTLCAAAGLAVAFAAPAAAQDWEYGLKPYFWAPGIDATYTFGGNPPTGGDSSFWDKFEGAFLLQGYARNGEWSLLGEFNYLKLGETYLPSVPVLTTDIGLDGYMVSGGVGRQLHRDQDSFVELYGGLRYWDVEMTALNPAFGGAQVDKAWVDPFVGLRGHFELRPGLMLVGRADIGGFGVGSKFQADLQGALSWAVGDTTKLELGYRHLAVDFEDTTVFADIALSGPYFALDFRF
ncbi:hypothetical protein [Shimia thalassica]|uniref:hypothetical protein n=1 Tax=Shimia thalassica TaxID=1715693 RepID=UPI0026E138D2|nr:hypothetical protein [Shimia thalassica]MDO6484415.1 hypothetical protein [Shimia thalassica]